ncbi:hypothetical protein [Shinella sp.]|uniref:hypothetical protein n=1 Tax=Shinella sp. TaxID=1870904 RepID=UPI0028B121DD|nr:hypothetical protein [Shinella sp.]
MPTQPRLLPPATPISLLVSPAGRPPQVAGEKTGAQRLKTWDIPTTFHCSIIGTCLTNGELRQILLKTGQEDAETATDHSLHGRGVRLAGQRDQAAKMLNKRSTSAMKPPSSVSPGRRTRRRSGASGAKASTAATLPARIGR